MPANGDVLFDTNVVTALFGGESSARERFARVRAAFVPSIVVGELIFGALKSSRVAENLGRIAAFMDDVPVLACGSQTARHYGQIKNDLRLKGTPIPENDLWIAAVAIEHGLILVTRDDHFSHVEPLLRDRW